MSEHFTLILQSVQPSTGTDVFVNAALAIVTFLREAGLLGAFVLLGFMLWTKRIILGWTYDEAISRNKDLVEENRQLRDALMDATRTGVRAAKVADTAFRRAVKRESSD